MQTSGPGSIITAGSEAVPRITEVGSLPYIPDDEILERLSVRLSSIPNLRKIKPEPLITVGLDRIPYTPEESSRTPETSTPTSVVGSWDEFPYLPSISSIGSDIASLETCGANRTQPGSPASIDNVWKDVAQSASMHSIADLATSTLANGFDCAAPTDLDLDHYLDVCNGLNGIGLHEEQTQAEFLMTMHEREKADLETITALELKLAEQEKRLAESVAFREEMLKEMKRKQEERITDYMTIVEEAKRKRAESKRDNWGYLSTWMAIPFCRNLPEGPPFQTI
jgi:hypothetical protein